MNANDYPRGSQTRLEYLESEVKVAPSPPEPKPTASAQAVYDSVNARIENVKRGHIERHQEPRP